MRLLPPSTRTPSAPAWIAVLVLPFVAVASGMDEPQGRRRDQEALQPFASLVGPWKGTGQPQRNNARGAWVETGDWAWSLTPESAALKLEVGKGKYLKSALLKPGAAAGAFRLDAVLADGSERAFEGRLNPADKGKLVLAATPAKGDGVRRLTLTPLHEARFLLLLEANPEDSDRPVRLAEVGYTKQGVAFAAGDAYPVCIVTGGRGTTQVTYEGKTYWVCCSGCKDLFNDDPKGVLADAAKKAKK